MGDKDLASKVQASFCECEAALRSWIAEMAIVGKDRCVLRGLDLVKQLDDLGTCFAQISTDPKRHHATESSPQKKEVVAHQSRRSSDNAFPVFFVHEESLVKYGKTRSDDPDKALYRKTMPLKDASLLIDMLIEFILKNDSVESIGIRDFIHFVNARGVDLPEYKIYLLFGALEAASVVVPAGRGLFSVKERSLSRSVWESKIGQLEERRDLVDAMK